MLWYIKNLIYLVKFVLYVIGYLCGVRSGNEIGSMLNIVLSVVSVKWKEILVFKL